MELPPLSEGNWLQRRYARWAEPHYRKLAPEQRAEAQRLERWLYSRHGWPAWLGVLLGLPALTTVLVRFTDFSLAGAAFTSLFAAFMFWCFVVEAWFWPDRFTAFRRSVWWRNGIGWTLVSGVVGAYAGFLVSWDWTAKGWPDLRVLVLPGAVMMAIGLPIFGLQWWIAAVRRRRLEEQLAAARAAEEREATARELAEARLRLLQAQIQPHFIFNTLSAVQHWVDVGDARASPLLRELTAFLRGATELLGNGRTTLGAEVTMIGHYLAIMQARLGERLVSRIDVPGELQGLELPPGLLLTLVENAVEHGLAPALAGGSVSVSAQADPATREVTVRVHDDGVGLAAGWQEGVGLANCRQRLVHHFGQGARLDLITLPQGTTALMRWSAPSLPVSTAMPTGVPA
ncbi:MAG: sensor histidine kinase [Rubrivivax sp.]